MDVVAYSLNGGCNCFFKNCKKIWSIVGVIVVDQMNLVA